MKKYLHNEVKSLDHPESRHDTKVNFIKLIHHQFYLQKFPNTRNAVTVSL